MKTTIKLIFLLLFINVSAIAQNNKLKKNQYQLTGKIVNDFKLPGNCGYIAYAFVLEFEIIDTSLKNYENKQIPIIVRCPKFFGENFFEKNKTYTLTFTDQYKKNFDWTIPNINVLKKYNLKKQYWLIDIK
ncbi:MULTISPECIES: hypothetical protein [unclassified Chryseobacterium]|uniref:hypothetical protein n=1 Tax=unclassified Chryseobacterium TaxID=2593645 RepID=UPI0021E60144|nr:MULTISPECIES: hypothetical protein [unclassified Chryseobacterium]MEA1848475.1 hypothetical protein [Chryseobacterium sp. MHB01]